MARACERLERCRLYINDIFTLNNDGAEDVENLARLFERLIQFNLKLAPRKAQLSAKENKFSGHWISAEGIAPDPEKAEVLKRMRMPTTLMQPRSLFGRFSYYRNFSPRRVALTKPLDYLLEKGVDLNFTEVRTSVVQSRLSKLVSQFRRPGFPRLRRGGLGRPTVHVGPGCAHRCFVWVERWSSGRGTELCDRYVLSAVVFCPTNVLR